MVTTIVILLLCLLWIAGVYSLRFVPPGKLRDNLEAYLYLAPAGLLLLTFWFIPVGLSVVISFTDWVGASRFDNVEWVGFKHYRRALTEDPNFMQVLWNTLNYVIYSVPLTMAGALGVAVLLNRPLKGRGLFRTIYFLPFITTWVAISVVFKYVFNEQVGLANYLLELVGGPRLAWLNESRGIFDLLLRDVFGFKLPAEIHPMLAGPSLAMFTVILTSVWRDIGYFMVIFLAGLQNIDRTYYEAAEIDGATPVQKFRHITWPLLSPTTFFVMVIAMITAFKIFVPMYVMTPTGGPGSTTSTLVFYLFQQGFLGYQDLGYASAIAYVLFVIILMLTVAQNRIFGKNVHYD
jgi:multiple sugar transport system permease protein